MNINWYPGHMKKTRESLKESMAMVDVVYELLDARVPISSENPIIDEIVKDKPRIKILNKFDLADNHVNKLWKDYFKGKGIDTVFMDASTGKGINELTKLTFEKTKEKRDNYKAKGVSNKPIRVMIIGVPNVGKSTLINTLSGRKGTKIGNKPGITRTNQWIKTKDGLQLLDTPGILWPKFDNKKVGLNLAFVGTIEEGALDNETLALRLVEKLLQTYPEKLSSRYKVDVEGKPPLEVMESIGFKRGCIIKGGEIDYTKVSEIILDEFRKSKIGNISLEKPEDSVEYE